MVLSFCLTSFCFLSCLIESINSQWCRRISGKKYPCTFPSWRYWWFRIWFFWWVSKEHQARTHGKRFFYGDPLFLHPCSYDSKHARQARQINQRAEPSRPLSLSIVIQIQMNLGRLESINGQELLSQSFYGFGKLFLFLSHQLHHIICRTNHRRGKRNVLIWLYANMGGSDFHTAAETLSLQSLGRSRHWWFILSTKKCINQDEGCQKPVTNHHRYSGMCRMFILEPQPLLINKDEKN